MSKKTDKRNQFNGRRAIDKLSPKMVMATGFVNLTGAPARLVTKWGMVGVVFWVVGNALLNIARELKGTNTFANIQFGIEAALSIKPNSVDGLDCLPTSYKLLVYLLIGLMLITGIALFYSFRERKLRGRVIHEMGLQITVLEKYFDRERRSSELTRTGETNPRDQ